MCKLHIYRGGLVAARLEIQYYDEALMHLDITIDMLSSIAPGDAIIPWVWAADDSPLHGKRLKDSGWHLPLLIARWRVPEALVQLGQSVLFTPLENVQVLERMEDGDYVLRTYAPDEEGWDLADEVEIVLEDAEFMLGL